MLYIIAGIVFVLLGALVLIYNRLVNLRQMVKSGWADIDVQLKRRADLIPSLVKTVKGYAKHEKDLFLDITAKRADAMNAGDDTQSRADAENQLTQKTQRLIAVAEDYPELKASQNFLDLQDELSETEDKIEMARRYYNGAVRMMNTAVQTFPTNLIAGMLGFSQKDYFEMSNDRSAPKVEL